MQNIVMSILLQFIYSPPPPFFTILSLLSFAFLANSGFLEISGKSLQYSKFWNMGSEKSTAKLSGRTGMLLAYTPAFVVGLVSFGFFPHGGLRFVLLKLALTTHFFKRILEVLFIHKYSGPMFLDVSIFLSFFYFINTSCMIYAQQLSTQGDLQDPQIDLKYVGIVIFLVGISGNLYHHYLLSKLRGKGEKEYKIPKGGLFNLVICPHYLFEVLGFLGVAFIAQTLYAFCSTLGMAVLLMGRSYATRKWYLSKFEDFPKPVKALIPFVF